MTTLPTLAPEWKVSFELNRQSSTYRSYASVLHLTIGGKSGAVGDRTPSIWFHRTVGVYIVTTLNGVANAGQKFKKHKPPIGEWTTFEISQTRKGSTHVFSVRIAGEEVWSEENSTPQEFSDVKVYASSPWYLAQAGSIRGLLIENKLLGKVILEENNSYRNVSVEPQEWQAWNEWSLCAVTCGRGNNVRQRVCPKPAVDGIALCRGDAIEFRECATVTECSGVL